ncbi:MaoC/PaaZ C-terminal domain-containing protein [Rhodococcus sp. ABRD24]|uniref:MaoC/PaaZ C-terminal domain-containing protein n=1 Tax=Rhodococcus sp. ABRD24 TaxID=2507582 RepID=UPI0026908F4B
MTAITQLEVGAELPALAIGEVTRMTLGLFASTSGDHNATHIKQDSAKSAEPDDAIAHGMLPMAYWSRLLTN